MIALGLVSALGSAHAVAPRSYYDAAACTAAGGHTAMECRQAYRNARAEFDEKAPHFATRAACERLFPRCMIADIFAHGGVDFMPAMGGFVFVPGRRALTAPVVEGAAGDRLFEPRAADRAEEGIDPRRAAAARRASTLKLAPAVMRPEVAEPEPPGGAEAPSVFPVPKAMLTDIRERERRYAGASKDGGQ